MNYQRTLMHQKWADYFQDMDVLLCPVTRVAVFSHDHQKIIKWVLRINNRDVNCEDALLPWVGLSGVAYFPATVAPIGFPPEGLPIGIQIVGPFLEDRTPIHFAKLIEDITGGFTPPHGY